MERKPQTYANHAKWDPMFHFVISLLVFVLIVGAIKAALNEGTGESWWRVGVSMALLLIALKSRLFALKAQDRLIRLEERLRMERLLPAELRPRIGELMEAQLIGLRFASDAELPGLVQKALSERLSTKQIKEAVQTWRPDYFRV